MAPVYFDSSALVKLVVDEEGSNLVASLWDGCDAALASRLAYPEVCAALAAARRNHDLGDHDHLAAVRAWDACWRAVRAVNLTPAVEAHAGDLTGRHALRGADAVHLASAIAVSTNDLIVAVWDRRLHDGVVAERLRVAPRALST